MIFFLNVLMMGVALICLDGDSGVSGGRLFFLFDLIDCFVVFMILFLCFCLKNVVVLVLSLGGI